MAERYDLDAIAADDALLDLLAAGGEAAFGALEAGADDPAIQLLADLRVAVEVEDELPVERIDDAEGFLARCAALNPVTDPLARKIAARTLALGVAAVAALSVSGVAAAVNGDPLSPYEKVIEKVVDGIMPKTSFPKEDLQGLPVSDKGKITRVAKDYRIKRAAQMVHDKDVAVQLRTEEEMLADVRPKPPVVNRARGILPPLVEKPAKVDPTVPPEQSTVKPIEPMQTKKPTGDPTVVPTQQPTQDPDPEPDPEPTQLPTEPEPEPTETPMPAATEPTTPPTTEPTTDASGGDSSSGETTSGVEPGNGVDATQPPLPQPSVPKVETGGDQDDPSTEVTPAAKESDPGQGGGDQSGDQGKEPDPAGDTTPETPLPGVELGEILRLGGGSAPDITKARDQQSTQDTSRSRGQAREAKAHQKARPSKHFSPEALRQILAVLNGVMVRR